MKKLRQPGQDSLDLLLDTLCNVFGSIILIACLLALLNRDRSAASPPIAPVPDAAGQLLEQRMLAAYAELEGLHALLEEIDGEGDQALRQLAAERDSLKSTLDRLRREQAGEEARAIASARQTSGDPASEIAKLQQQERAARLRLTDLQTQLAAAREKTRHLRDRLTALDEEQAAEVDKQTVTLRLPKERARTRENRTVLLQFGEIFPLTDGEGHLLDGVRVTPKDEKEESYTVQALQGAGLGQGRDDAVLRRIFINHRDTGGYLVLYVYPDSFDTFRRLKPLLHELGVEYGVSVCHERQVLSFGPKGQAPNPL